MAVAACLWPTKFKIPSVLDWSPQTMCSIERDDFCLLNPGSEVLVSEGGMAEIEKRSFFPPWLTF